MAAERRDAGQVLNAQQENTMKRLASTMMVLAIASVIAAACGRPAEQAPPPESAPARPGSPETESKALDITFKSEPDPPKMGENTFGVQVMGGNSQPVTDAEVSVQFYMPAMPDMKMPAMRTTVPLKHEGGGRYRGKGNIAMAGAWDATVMVMRGGQEIGNRKFSVTVK